MYSYDYVNTEIAGGSIFYQKNQESNKQVAKKGFRYYQVCTHLKRLSHLL